MTTRAGSVNPAPALVSPAWLQVRLQDPGVVPVEVSADAWTYYSGHVPGAVMLDWYDDVHRPDRRGALDQGLLESVLGARGIDADSHVVLYGDQGNMLAGYAYWLLRYYRHARVSLLDGGRRGWVDAGAPLTREVRERRPRDYRSPGADPSVRLVRDQVLARYVGAAAQRPLIDCRPADVYAGRRRPTNPDLPLLGYGLSGHIPGAVNVPTAAVLDRATGRFRPPVELRALFAAAGVGPGSQAAFYCTAGAESALPWFALSEVLGHPSARLYEGGWAEYGSLVAVPTASGHGPGGSAAG